MNGNTIASLVLLSAVAVAQDDSKLRWVGCGIAKRAFMSALADGYQKHCGVEVTLEGGGATRGIRDVAAGKADLGGTCRHKLDRADEAAAVLHPVGWDAIVVVVHPDNPVQDISFGDLKKVLTGKVDNWRQLGGPDQTIEVFARASKTSGVGLMARELIFWNPGVEFSGATRTFRSSGPLEKQLEKSRFAIGLTGVSSAHKRKLKMLKVSGKAPNPKNIMTGSYPVVRPLYLVSNKDAPQHVRDFVAWTLKDGQRLIRKEGTVTAAQGKKLWVKYNKLMKGIRMRQRAAARPAKPAK